MMMGRCYCTLFLVATLLSTGLVSSLSPATTTVDAATTTFNPKEKRIIDVATPQKKRRRIVPTAQDLSVLAHTRTKKTPGSSRYRKLWRHWSRLSMYFIQDTLVEHHLPHPIDHVATQQLTFQLGNCSDLGIRPSFANPGARSGYAAGRFGRALLLADLFLINTYHNSNNNLIPLLANGISHLLVSSPRDQNNNESSTRYCRLASIGGACGYDFVAAALVASFHSSDNNSNVVVQATVFDYEEGWEDLVDAVSTATRASLGVSFPQSDDNGKQHVCSFGGKCDITKSLNDDVNAKLLQMAETMDVWTCQYCISENAVQLQNSKFVFFVELFRVSKEGAVFLFTETTHRLWPALLHAVGEVGFDVAFPVVGGRTNTGRQMVIRKRRRAEGGDNTIMINDEDVVLCKMFQKDNDMHEQRIKNGVLRQSKKNQGFK